MALTEEQREIALRIAEQFRASVMDRRVYFGMGADDLFFVIERFLAALPKPEPVAEVDANDDGYWADILPNRSVKVGQLLYTEAPFSPPENVPCEKCGQSPQRQSGIYECSKCGLPLVHDAPPASEQKPAEWDQDAAIEALIDFAPRSSLQAEMIEQVSFDPTSGPVYALTTQGRALLDQLKVAFFAAVPQSDYKAQRDSLLKCLELIEPKLDFSGWENGQGEDIGNEIKAAIASVKGNEYIDPCHHAKGTLIHTGDGIPVSYCPDCGRNEVQR